MDRSEARWGWAETPSPRARRFGALARKAPGAGPSPGGVEGRPGTRDAERYGQVAKLAVSCTGTAAWPWGLKYCRITPLWVSVTVSV
jgi:hypothetical protein